MTISNRLVLLLVGAIVMLLVVGGIGLGASGRLASSAEAIGTQSMPAVLNAAKIRAATLRSVVVAKEMLMLGSASRRGELAAELAQQQKDTRDLIAEYAQKFTTTPADRDAATQMRTNIEQLFDVEKKVAELVQGGMTADAEEHFGKTGAPVLAAAMQALDSVFTARDREATAQAAAAVSIASGARTATIIALLVGLAVTLGVGGWTLQTIRRPLEQTRRTMSRVAAELDFTQRLPIGRRDEIGATAEAFNSLADNVQKSFRELAAAVERSQQAADRLNGITADIARSSASQSDSTASVAASVEQLTVGVDQISHRAADARHRAADAGAEAKSGSAVVRSTVAAIDGIARTVREASAELDALDRQSQNIGAVVQVIKEVADQTSLLALNAAIEAARAGEQGRGFAVVADEVRKLAERTTHSTEEIGTLLAGISNGTKAAAARMTTAVGLVDRGVEEAKQAGGAMERIETAAANAVEHVGEISDAIREQSQASASVAQLIERIAQMTEQNSTAAGNAAEAAAELDRLSQNMRAAVERFRV